MNKSSAVAEMGDRLTTIDMGRKEGGCYALIALMGPTLGPHLIHCGLGRGLPPYQVAYLDPSSRLATTDMRRQLGERLCPFGGGGAGSPSNTMWVEAYLRVKWHLDPSRRLATIRGPKIGGLLCPPFWRGGAGSASNRMSPGRGLPPYQMVSSSIQPFGHNGSGPPEIPGNQRSLKFPAGIPGNFEDFPKLLLFMDSDGSILLKTRLFRITFR